MKALLIAQATLKEFVRGKMLYTLLACGIALTSLGVLFGSVSIGQQEIVLKDFGLFSISLLSVSFVVIAGPIMLHKELALKTIYTLLARPVSRSQFILGKFIGVYLSGLTFIIVLAIILIGVTSLLEPGPDFALLQALVYIAMELLLICSVMIFFSAILITPALSGILTLATFLIGRSSSYLLYFIKSGELTPNASFVLRALYKAVPDFESLQVANTAVFGVTQSFAHLSWALLYVLCYSLVLLGVAIFVFNRRQFT